MSLVIIFIVTLESLSTPNKTRKYSDFALTSINCSLPQES